MPFRRYKKRPVQFTQQHLKLETSVEQERILRTAAVRPGRIGIPSKDSKMLLEVVYALALWRGLCRAVPSQIVLVRENDADRWHEVLGLFLRNATPIVAQQVRYARHHRSYEVNRRIPLMAAVTWPEVALQPDGGADVYFMDFKKTPAYVIDDVCADAQPGRLLVLPVWIS